jgi:cytochrome P450
MKFSAQALIVSSLALPSEGFSTGNAGRAKTNQQVFTTVSTTKLSSTTDADLERERISALPLPPSRNQGPFRGLRESISHLSNNKRFVEKRRKELGPVFLSNIFFQPTVVIGGNEAVKEFVSGTELRSKVINAALPDTFKELHTKWGTLNLDSTDVVFKQARKLFTDILGKSALTLYTGLINDEMDRYIADLSERVQDDPDREILLVAELKDLCLQIFSKIFSGKGLSDEQVQMFNDYNNALLSLPFEKKKLEKGRLALDTLKKDMISRFKEGEKGDAQGDSNASTNLFHDMVDGREGFEDDDRIASVMVLMIWAAYIECASLMVNSLTAITKYDTKCTDKILAELNAQESKATISASDYAFWSEMNETLGVLRESLRLIPPGGGTQRFSEEDFELLGYRIPAGTAVMMDPRVGNTDPNLFTEPEKFAPSRWVPLKTDEAASGCPFEGTALKLGVGSWFPGGFGAHQCPGLPLAELTSKMFLAKSVKAFEGWQFESGLDKNGDVKFVEVPIKIPTDCFGVKFSARKE